MPQHWAETLIAETAASSPLAAAAARAAHQARLPLLPKRADPQQPEDQRQGVRLQRRALAAGSRDWSFCAARLCARTASSCCLEGGDAQRDPRQPSRFFARCSGP